MLALVGGTAKRPLSKSAGTLTAREEIRPAGIGLSWSRQAALDPLSVLLVALLVVGLASIGLAAWFVYMRRSLAGVAPTETWPTQAWGTDAGRLPLPLGATLTRDAQQAEIARLRGHRTSEGELEQLHRELATGADAHADVGERTSVQASPGGESRASSSLPAPALTPGSASTVLERPPLALILDVPVYKQQRSLSCESSVAAMAANFHGISVSEGDILLALPGHENPHLGFRGNVDGSYGGIEDYGVYAEPIRQVLAGLGLQVEHLEDGGLDEIKRHVRQGRPVIAWVTYRLQVENPRRVTLSDGQTVTMVPYEHTVLVVGYNRNGLWVNDPYDGTQGFCSESDFVRSFAYLGNMGLVVGPPVAR